MGLLTDKYGLTDKQERALVRDGIVHFAPVNYYEIFQHWSSIRELYESNGDAVLDCCLHFKLKKTMIYEAIKTYR